MTVTHMYEEIRDALKAQIESGLASEGEATTDVYITNYQNIPMFPAITLQVERRRKVKRAANRVRQLEFDLSVWVYVKLYDAEDAERECLRITEIVEAAIESDKTLNGTAHYLTIDDNLEFGTVATGNDGDVFLQGARIQLTITKRFQ
ncbi:hypothetical protein EG878_14540 [Enterococcus faecalis]|nr:hypothetical protein EG878_14540 [Enterococcus faecalis]